MKKFALTLVVLMFLLASGPSVLAEDYYGVAFSRIESLGIFTEVYLLDLDMSGPETSAYLSDVLFTELHGKFPASFKISPAPSLDASLADGQVWLIVLMKKDPLGGYFGAVTIALKRWVALIPIEEPVMGTWATVYDDTIILLGGSQSDLKTRLRNTAEDLVLSFATDFYKWRPDLW